VAIRPRPVAGVVGYLVLGDTPLGVRIHNITKLQQQDALYDSKRAMVHVFVNVKIL